MPLHRGEMRLLGFLRHFENTSLKLVKGHLCPKVMQNTTEISKIASKKNEVQ